MFGNLTILKYEIKRILLLKRNMLLAGILLLCSNYFTEMCIGGAEIFEGYFRLKYQWGYSNAICLTNNVLYAVMILLCVSVYTPREKKAREIITACPISPARYYLIKGSAIFITFSIFLAIPIGYTFLRCYNFYHFYSYNKFLVPIFLFVMAGAIMVFGLSMICGKVNNKIPYFFIPVVVFMGMYNFLDLPNILDICCNDFFVNYWKYLKKLPKINGLERAYIIPMGFLFSRIIYVITGIVLFCLTFIRKESIRSKVFKAGV